MCWFSLERSQDGTSYEGCLMSLRRSSESNPGSRKILCGAPSWHLLGVHSIPVESWFPLRLRWAEETTRGLRCALRTPPLPLFIIFSGQGVTAWAAHRSFLGLSPSSVPLSSALEMGAPPTAGEWWAAKYLGERIASCHFNVHSPFLSAQSFFTPVKRELENRKFLFTSQFLTRFVE